MYFVTVKLSWLTKPQMPRKLYSMTNDDWRQLTAAYSENGLSKSAPYYSNYNVIIPSVTLDTEDDITVLRRFPWIPSKCSE